MKDKILFAAEDSHCSSVVVENLKKTVKYKSDRQPKVTRLKLPIVDQIIGLLNQPKFQGESTIQDQSALPFCSLLYVIFMARAKIIQHTFLLTERAKSGIPENPWELFI